MTGSQPKCPNCGSHMIPKDGSHVCAEFEGYKDELANRKLGPSDFMVSPRPTTQERG